MIFNIQNELGEQAGSCALGILIMEQVHNNSRSDRLASVKHRLEDSIRQSYGQATRAELKALPPMEAYVSYYKRFGYTYHVLSQLESVIKGKEIPEGLPLVEAMFMAELKNMLLTAGHDYNQVKGLLRLISPAGQESYTTLGGRAVTTIPGDIMVADEEGVISSILRGPDLRTAITERTKRVVYMTYAPCGVEESLIYRHLNDIELYVMTASADAITCVKQIL